MTWRARNHSNFWAFAVHRVSGLLLAIFLPFHFWALGTAIAGAARLDDFLAWTEQPLVKLAEVGLIVLLAAHLTGGLRLLAIELLAWRGWQKTAVSLSAGISLAIGLLFLLNVL
jgi:fumarate reductase subunit D